MRVCVCVCGPWAGGEVGVCMCVCVCGPWAGGEVSVCACVCLCVCVRAMGRWRSVCAVCVCACVRVQVEK